jgi:hypothetical protein
MAGFPDTLDVDENDYPDDERLKEISQADAVGVGGRWLVKVFPGLVESLSYGTVTVTELEDETSIRVATGGWSGIEDLIAAVLGNALLRLMYYAAWNRGGVHFFVVPHKDQAARPT